MPGPKPGPIRRQEAVLKSHRLLAAFVATAITMLVGATSSDAALPHLVRPGESLWSIAAANNLTTRTVAAYNGLSVGSNVVAGRTIMVPTVAQGAAMLGGAAAPAQTSTVSAPPPQGAYIVRPGDT